MDELYNIQWLVPDVNGRVSTVRAAHSFPLKRLNEILRNPPRGATMAQVWRAA